jgi:hypothetical protein
VYTKPGRECHRTLNLAPVRPHFGDSGVASIIAIMPLSL